MLRSIGVSVCGWAQRVLYRVSGPSFWTCPNSDCGRGLIGDNQEICPVCRTKKP